MFKLLDGRTELWQWDLNRKIIVSDSSIDEVHFYNETGDSSLVVAVYEQDGQLLADIPNILLQTDWPIKVYGYCVGYYTKIMATFKVNARTRPDNYVYTETQVKRWEDLANEIDEKIVTLDAAEAERVSNEELRVRAEEVREANELSRKANELSRETEYAQLSQELRTIITDGNEKLAELETAVNHEKRITQLEKHISQDYFQTDDTVAYKKTVPANVCPYAAIEEVGGMTYKTKNVLPYPYYANTANNSNVWENGGITYTLLENGYVHVQGTVTAFSAMFLRYNYDDVLRNGATYTLGLFVKEGNSTGLTMAAAIKDKATGTDSYIANNSRPTFTVNKELYEYSWIRLNVPTVGTEIDCVVGPQIEEGSAATEYSPWFEGLRHSPVTEIKSVGADGVINSLAIPKEVQAFDGCGWGITSIGTGRIVSNHIVWKPDQGIKEYRKQVVRVELTGNENIYADAAYPHVFRVSDIVMIHAHENGIGLCAEYTCVRYSSPIGNLKEGEFALGYGRGGFAINTGYSSVNEWKAYLKERYNSGNPVVFYLEAVNEEITDISNLLSDDNFINVEGAGAIEFVNEHSQAVPSSITYLLKEGSV